MITSEAEVLCFIMNVDINECATGRHSCQQVCINNVGSYTCSCEYGYALHSNGFDCEGIPYFISHTFNHSVCSIDVNECLIRGPGGHNCSLNATCENTPVGSFTCQCLLGFTGDGTNCTGL